MTFRGCPHEGGLPASIILTVNTGAARQERFYRSECAGPSRRHQWGFAAGKGSVRIRAGGQEELDYRAVSIRAREREWRHAISVRCLYVGAGSHQQVHDLQIVVIRRPMQRRHPIDLRRVHIETLLQERANARPVVLFCRIRQGRTRNPGGRALR
jgi:hypothetical protein